MEVLEMILVVPFAILFWGTPIAIVLWMFLRTRRTPRPPAWAGLVALLVWLVVAALSIFLATFFIGGHTGSEARLMILLYVVAVTVFFATVLWKLCRKLRPPEG